MTERKDDRLWGGRFEREPNKQFDAFQRSFAFDRRLLLYEIAVDRVWAKALHPVGIFTAFNQIRGPKEAVAMVNSPHNHQATPEQQEAIRKSNWTAGLMQYAGPVVFNEIGDNPNAVTTVIQILGGKPVAVWPREAAVQKFVFPRPKA